MQLTTNGIDGNLHTVCPDQLLGLRTTTATSTAVTLLRLSCVIIRFKQAMNQQEDVDREGSGHAPEQPGDNKTPASERKQALAKSKEKDHRATKEKTSSNYETSQLAQEIQPLPRITMQSSSPGAHAVRGRFRHPRPRSAPEELSSQAEQPDASRNAELLQAHAVEEGDMSRAQPLEPLPPRRQGIWGKTKKLVFCTFWAAILLGGILMAVLLTKRRDDQAGTNSDDGSESISSIGSSGEEGGGLSHMPIKKRFQAYPSATYLRVASRGNH